MKLRKRRVFGVSALFVLLLAVFVFVFGSGEYYGLGENEAVLDWQFFTHAEPDFRSEVLNVFGPQVVYLHERLDDGWGRIATYSGDAWVYLGGNYRFLPRMMGLFEYYGQARHVSYVGAQLLSVLQDYGRWIQVSTWMGPMWVDLEFMPSAAPLDDYFRSFGTNIGVFYMNLDTGFTYMRNPDRIFFGASVPKLFHALYVFELAERGLVDLYRLHTFTQADFWGGTGVMRHIHPFGSQHTTRELLGYSIRESDNVAFRMLVQAYNHPDFTFAQFVRHIGANPAMTLNTISQNTSARDAGIWAQAVLTYIESDNQFGHYLLYDMQNTSVNFITADYAISSKYGWYHHNFHDLTIVHADSPYILIVLSNQGREGGAHITNQHTPTHELFVDISEFMQNFNRRYFSPS